MKPIFSFLTACLFFLLPLQGAPPIDLGEAIASVEDSPKKTADACVQNVNYPHIVVLPAGAVHNGDFFALTDSVEISGTVNGDVYVLANQVVIDGTVNGDVLAASGSIEISGTVTHNVRALGGQVLIDGKVGNNVTAVAGNVQLLPSGSIHGSTVIVAGNADLAAEIDSTATVVASNLRVSSALKGFLQAYVGQLRVTSKANIQGDIDYRSSTVAWIDSGAVIQGIVTHHPSLVHELVKGTWIQGLLVGSKVVALLMNFFYTLIIGVILIKIFPKNLDAALRILNTHPWKSFSYGLMLLILLPLASLILLMTILGVPFALALIAANIICLYTAKIYSIFWASQFLCGRIGWKVSRFALLFFGLILYFCLTAIPVFGFILSIASMLFGLGAGVLAQAARHRYRLGS